MEAGVSEPDARITAEVLVLADSWGISTHGLVNLPGYLRRIRSGGIRGTGRPRITAEGPAWAVVDGDSALGMVGAVFAMSTAIRKARACGVAYTGLRNTCHLGAVGCYAVMAAREGMIGIAMANDTPTVNAPGAAGPVFGSNPLSFAAPAGDEPPLLLDIATSTVAGAKVLRAAERRIPIPPDWVVTAGGQSTTDPGAFASFPHRGALTPMAAHKGYGLAFAIETLTSVLTGANVIRTVASWSFSDPCLSTGHSAAFLVLDCGAFPSAPKFQDNLCMLIREVRGLPRSSGAARICVPGEMEWECHARGTTEGIELAPEAAVVFNQLRQRLSPANLSPVGNSAGSPAALH